MKIINVHANAHAHLVLVFHTNNRNNNSESYDPMIFDILRKRAARSVLREVIHKLHTLRVILVAVGCFYYWWL